MRLLLALNGLVFGVAALTIACGDDCRLTEPYACHTISVDTKAGEAGTEVTWQGFRAPVVEPQGNEPPPDGACIVTLTTHSEQWASDGGAGAEEFPDALGHSAGARCVAGDVEISMGATLDDFRDIGPGVVAATAGGATSAVNDDESPSCYLSASATMTILESTGGSAPFPDVVTPDYRKVIRVDMHITGFQSGSCDGTVPSFEVTTTFTMTAADFHSSEGYCQLEVCG